MITDNDVKKLAKVFITKKDAKKFATKDDLKGFATKDDLKGFATKDDIQDLKKVDENLAKEIVVIKTDIADIRENMMTKADGRQIMTAVDGVLKELVTMRIEREAHNQQHEDNDNDHKVFKNRLTKIESIPVIAHEIKKK